MLRSRPLASRGSMSSGSPQVPTVMNFKLKGQQNLLSSITLIQYNLFLNSFSQAKAWRSDSQQITASACKSEQFISSKFIAARVVPLAAAQLSTCNYPQKGLIRLCWQSGQGKYGEQAQADPQGRPVRVRDTNQRRG